MQSVWEHSFKETMCSNVHEQCGIGVEAIMKTALNKRTLDNITVVMVAFEGYKDKLFPKQNQSATQASNLSKPISSAPAGREKQLVSNDRNDRSESVQRIMANLPPPPSGTSPYLRTALGDQITSSHNAKSFYNLNSYSRDQNKGGIHDLHTSPPPSTSITHGLTSHKVQTENRDTRGTSPNPSLHKTYENVKSSQNEHRNREGLGNNPPISKASPSHYTRPSSLKREISHQSRYDKRSGPIEDHDRENFHPTSLQRPLNSLGDTSALTSGGKRGDQKESNYKGHYSAKEKTKETNTSVSTGLLLKEHNLTNGQVYPPSRGNGADLLRKSDMTMMKTATAKLTKKQSYLMNENAMSPTSLLGNSISSKFKVNYDQQFFNDLTTKYTNVPRQVA